MTAASTSAAQGTSEATDVKVADAAPAKAPCVSCPYRRDVPSGIWAEEEYARLPAYDGDTGEQAVQGATGVFYCHQQDGRICAGWAGTHDMEESLAVRFAVSYGRLSEDEYNALCDYTTDVPLFASGAEAAAHGRRKIEQPGSDAIKMIRRLERK
jgi:uncharacterized protein DUF6283